MFAQRRRVRNVVFVNTSGSATGNGSASNPTNSLAVAVSILSANGGGTAYITAPIGTPLTGGVVIDTQHPITLRSATDETPWYVNGGTICLDIRGGGLVTLVDGDFTGTTNGVQVGSTATGPAVRGIVSATRCRAEGGTNGWRTISTWTTLDATDCTGLGGTNDGWNINSAGTCTLTSCIGDDCGDEGASPHVSAVLNIIGGHYNGNQESGMAAVDAAVCNISGGAVFDGNGFSNSVYGGVFYGGTASGVINGATFSNNAGPGISRSATSGTVTLTAYTSTGNGDADDL